MNTPRVDCCVVGDATVGKTSMLITYCNGTFPAEYVPSVNGQFFSYMTVDGTPIRLELWDTAGQSDYDRLRPLVYPHINVALVCFAVDNRISFESVFTKWIPEVLHYSRHATIILVGTKSDLRSTTSSTNADFVSVEEVQRLLAEFLLSGYFECSSRLQLGLNELMLVAARAGLKRRQTYDQLPTTSSARYVRRREKIRNHEYSDADDTREEHSQGTRRSRCSVA